MGHVHSWVSESSRLPAPTLSLTQASERRVAARKGSHMSWWEDQGQSQRSQHPVSSNQSQLCGTFESDIPQCKHLCSHKTSHILSVDQSRERRTSSSWCLAAFWTLEPYSQWWYWFIAEGIESRWHASAAFTPLFPDRPCIVHRNRSTKFSPLQQFYYYSDSVGDDLDDPDDDLVAEC